MDMWGHINMMMWKRGVSRKERRRENRVSLFEFGNVLCLCMFFFILMLFLERFV